MTMYTTLAFAGAMFLLAATPGPGVFAVISRALASGFKNALFVVMGIVFADFLFLLLVVFGLSAIAAMMGEFFVLVKYLGGAYLIYLGYKIITSKDEDINVKGVYELSPKKNFLTGLIVTLSNPKAILFYLSFLPTFVDLEALTSVDIIVIYVVITIVLGGVMSAYAYSASGAKKLFKSKTARKKMNIAAGSTMATAGAVLIVKS